VKLVSWLYREFKDAFPFLFYDRRDWGFDSECCALYRMEDADLDSGFPFKSGEDHKSFSVLFWYKLPKTPMWKKVWKYFKQEFKDAYPFLFYKKLDGYLDELLLFNSRFSPKVYERIRQDGYVLRYVIWDNYC